MFLPKKPSRTANTWRSDGEASLPVFPGTPDRAAVPDGYWHYAAFSNGVAVSRDARLLYRDIPDLRADDDLFDAEKRLYAWLSQARAAMLTLPATGVS